MCYKIIVFFLAPMCVIAFSDKLLFYFFWRSISISRSRNEKLSLESSDMGGEEFRSIFTFDLKENHSEKITLYRFHTKHKLWLLKSNETLRNELMSDFCSKLSIIKKIKQNFFSFFYLLGIVFDFRIIKSSKLLFIVCEPIRFIYSRVLLFFADSKFVLLNKNRDSSLEESLKVFS